MTKTKGTKTTRRTATTKRGKTTPRVTAKSMAADIDQRDRRRPGFWHEVQAEIQALWSKRNRAAQVEHATH